jgi:DNA transformation protein
MKKRSPFLTNILNHLNQVAPVTARSMFGGYGLYSEGVMFALIAYDTLFFKVDDGNLADYQAAGSEPFRYDRNGKPIEMSYYRLPDDVFEDLEQLANWVESAREAARRSKMKSKPRRKKSDW